MTRPEETMLAIDPDMPGGPEVLRPVVRAVPTPAPGELLLRVAAAGINRPDVLQRRGKYAPPPGTSTVLGLEVAGTVAAVGNPADSHLIGQPMCALVAGGGYAQYALAPVGQCLPVPQGLTMVEAAAIPETFFTVWSNLFERAHAREGETVLVHGGTSGIGTTAILLAKAFGLRVVVTCGSDDKCNRAKELGADFAINYKDQDFVAEVLRLTGGVEIVLDMVAGDYVGRNLQCLLDDGRCLIIALQRGARTEIDLAQIMVRRLTLTGSTLRPRSIEFKSLIADQLHQNIWPLIEAGDCRPVIDSVFPLAEAAAAHQRMEAGDHVGKIVLEIP